MTPHPVISLILLGLVQAAALPSRTVSSLYNANDKVSVLGGQNFSSTVYQSETAWLIEFYASWCGHCQNYAKVRVRRWKERCFFWISNRNTEKLASTRGVSERNG